MIEPNPAQRFASRPHAADPGEIPATRWWVPLGLSYGLLALLAGGLYALLLGLASRLGPAPAPDWLHALILGLTSLLLQPLRRPINQLVSRLLARSAPEPAGAAALRLAHSLAQAPEPASLGSLLVEGLWRALPLEYAALTLATAEEPDGFASERGVPTSTPREVALLHQGRPLGSLQLAPTRPLTPPEEQWLDELAWHAGPALQAAQATLALEHTHAVLTAELADERRRIQRELHDGLGPALASLVLALDSLRRRTETGRLSPEQALAGLDSLKTDARQISAEIQTLVAQLRPPVLDQVGLAEAVRYFAGSLAGPLVVDVAAPARLPPLPAAVEHAAYRIICEALTNTVRHAQASHCRVHLELTPAALVVRIQDDGRGTAVAAPATGLGLASMRARAEELGGQFTFQSAPNVGATVLARLPLTEVPDAG